MLRLVSVAVLLLAGSCYGGERIVGGQPANIEDYPSIVQLERNVNNVYSFYCGANILNNLYILSAAHCFDGRWYDPSLVRIRAGATPRSSGGITINIIREFNHPTWGTYGNEGDITVVSLSAPLTFSNVIQPSWIPPANFVVPDNVPVTHAGWGRTSFGGTTPTTLLDVQIYTVNLQKCIDMYVYAPWEARFTENMICAGVVGVGGRDACQGDSGGPLYYKTQGVNVTVGVISWGHECALPDFPGVSIAVSKYYDWIVELASQPV